MREKYKLGIHLHQLCLNIPEFQSIYEELGNEVKFMAEIQDMDIICQGYLTNQYYQKSRSTNTQMSDEIKEEIDHSNHEEQVTYYVSHVKIISILSKKLMEK